MQKIDLFERLEVANAQIDIWIDEEEYGKVIDSCEIDKELKANEKDDRTLDKVLKTAFSHESCTTNKDHEWLSILNHSSCPISAICNIPQEGDRIELNSPCFDTWSRFFWAKLIRAKIQQKGTDCYYRRLDQVVAYLERHCPPIQLLKQQEKNKQQEALLLDTLAVIYLLEMAAAGEAADQRSFAERARRVLREIGGDGSFYDFLARYNIGVGYFHEQAYRKAVLEFNWIIRELKAIWDKKGNFCLCLGTMEYSIHERLGRDLLYLPAVLYRAEIQLKLQLAYHSQRTISEYLESPGLYKLSQANLIKAEAYQQMGRRQQVWQTLCKVYNFAHGGSSLKCKRVKKPFTVKPGSRFANLKGRLQGLLIDYHMNEIKETWGKMQLREMKEMLDCLNRFFEKHKSSTEHQRENRKGYFEQLAEYIAFLADKSDEKDKEKGQKSSKAQEMVRELFNKNKDDILASENAKHYCPCEEKGIDLRRLNQDHYDTFSKNIRKYFRKFAKQDSSFQEDQKEFLNRLKTLEEKTRENLCWRIRKIELEESRNSPQPWCARCLPQWIPNPVAFAKLLVCANNNVENDDKKDNEELYAEDYERIMDHWDEHFLEHMRYPSFHEPRCRAIHFLGLQRWNSTSPAQGRSLGGGYLIYHTDEKGYVDLGVAIDPGFDFVRNLFHVGFSLADIDVVLLSHAHVDHVRDFESMVTLLLELHKRTKHTNKEIKRKLHAIMTLGVYRRLEYLIDSPGLREFIEPYILDIEKEIDPQILDKCKFEFIQGDDHLAKLKPSDKPDKAELSNKSKLVRFVTVLPKEEEEKRVSNSRINLRIRPTKAYHNDFSDYSDSFGFIINIKDPIAESSIDYTFGYTGDTSWYGDIIKGYVGCDALLVHLGSLIDREKDERKRFNHYEKGGEKCFTLIRDKNHPYLMGMLHFFTEIYDCKREGNKPLILMGEFGEELRGGIRLDFIGRLKKAYGLDILPVDVGLDVLLACDSSNECKARSTSNGTNGNPKVWCVQCKHFVALDDAAFIPYGHDEALFCVCKTCKKATPVNVLQERLRALYEVGRRLQIH